MTSQDDEFSRAMSAASERVHELHAELHDAHPPFRGNLAIPGIRVGHGLGAFVANGMPDDQIVTHVLTIVAQIRQSIGKPEPQAVKDDDVTLH